MTRRGSTLSKTMLQAIVQADHVASPETVRQTYSESVREEAARYFRALASMLTATEGHPVPPSGLEIECPHCGETITEKDLAS